MKKLLIAMAIVATAAFANAAAISWKTSTTGKLYEAGTSTLVTGVTAYLFDSTALSQSEILNKFVGGTDISTWGAVSSAAVSAGAIPGTTVDGYTTGGQTLDAYLAVVLDDSIYVSEIKTMTVPATGTSTTQFVLKTSSQAAALDISGGYSTAGWYQTAAVPEPTSGLLLLLGMAGLALKRKHA